MKFYHFQDGIKEIQYDQIQKERPTVGYISMEELEEYGEQWGFSGITIRDCKERRSTFRNSVDIFEDYSFSLLNRVDMDNIMGPRDTLALYLRRNLCVMVDIVTHENRNEELFEKAVHFYKPETLTVGKFLYAFFETMIANDNAMLERKEMALNALEDQVLRGEAKETFNEEFLIIKKKVSVLKSYYEQLEDIAETLGDNVNGIFSEKELYSMGHMDHKIERRRTFVESLREHLIQVRDAHQAAMDYDLNQVMKFFTVVTTIFFPLTLIVGWYGMNFTGMKELTWRYGYVTVIVVSVLVVVVSIWYFKKKKLM